MKKKFVLSVLIAVVFIINVRIIQAAIVDPNVKSSEINNDKGSSSNVSKVNFDISSSVIPVQNALQILTDSKVDCRAKDGTGQPSGGEHKSCLKVCDSTAVKYYTVATIGSTYQWIVTGAIPPYYYYCIAVGR